MEFDFDFDDLEWIDWAILITPFLGLATWLVYTFMTPKPTTTIPLPAVPVSTAPEPLHRGPVDSGPVLIQREIHSESTSVQPLDVPLAGEPAVPQRPASQSEDLQAIAPHSAVPPLANALLADTRPVNLQPEAPQPADSLPAAATTPLLEQEPVESVENSAAEPLPQENAEPAAVSARNHLDQATVLEPEPAAPIIAHHDEPENAPDTPPDAPPVAGSSAQARLEASRAEQLARLDAQEAGDGVLHQPRRLGKKKARSNEMRENMRRHREWEVAYFEEREKRRAAQAEDRARRAAEQEELQQEEEARRVKELMAEQKRRERELAWKELEEAQKQSVYDIEDVAEQYIRDRCVVDLEVAAKELDVRLDELQVFVEDKLEEEKWFGQFDDQGRFIYLDRERIALIRQQLLEHGRIAKLEARALLLPVHR
ncbi:hypothetical protein AMAG_00330 [Allomyces macrogynus ATCC 38327]|uniref:DDRGK domain-containing protein 1 n=1 Tax=Allomyces macrogynus (strain ATCC 38327) TaxID=578462 RepID=A0A0L0RW90_ALLM3|nr:hypothetical protein AMAG_00330 [Allomyces macrogynus ATCC 38327]|eukprot:KNE54351.1 hypothetical protein AMAG_00330 [Allomyces macrogynus ATCC 38327]